ncbi:hypothetical protein [Robiginitalea sp. SC105]|uniref:hypothetical protein n=1 Tax=Robiginitalea sp. SC105 TaxID=2762332 RepID=UPI00163982D9|nr:hypothetical protein [Robiginitalea sp. SC105]MBC2839589.1 hypothetical protein [Robiginitalea sp. SC105]
MITCEQAVTICHKNQYREATFMDRLRLWTHLAVCRQCARFSRKNSRLTDLCNQASLRSLSEAEKEAIRKRLDQVRGQGPAN